MMYHVVYTANIFDGKWILHYFFCRTIYYDMLSMQYHSKRTKYLFLNCLVVSTWNSSFMQLRSTGMENTTFYSTSKNKEQIKGLRCCCTYAMELSSLCNQDCENHDIFPTTDKNSSMRYGFLDLGFSASLSSVLPRC